ncbi:hypothetical protein F3J23_14660 [Chryseobacterium sp. Tr-659]|uniref:hypothetical protein n=1 Tax=Chryseobacterium sp. Tr-659 TaxID=2608340 RepID=UPI00142406FE|nr:hypothetical protein [Chryseobacterium sp. Tr-659]NIF06689.1 hypothetical protein [Chryseobacterium sp. Tr-659]
MCIHAQIGFNTPNPKANIHIDLLKNNPTSGDNFSEKQTSDDVSIKTINGNAALGIGNINPQRSLDITGPGQNNPSSVIPAIRIKDGNQQKGYVLTSLDDSGDAVWAPYKLDYIRGKRGNGLDIPFKSIDGYANTGSYITLPPGDWFVTAYTLLIRDGGGGIAPIIGNAIWIRTSFSDSKCGTNFGDCKITNDIEAGGPTLISGLLPINTVDMALLSGSLIIHNTSDKPKTYYYIAGQTKASTDLSTGSFLGVMFKPVKVATVGGGWAENIIHATRAGSLIESN